MTDNVINMSEWLKQKRLSKLKQMWFWYPIRDENEPLGYRLELVEAIPLEPRSIVSNGAAAQSTATWSAFRPRISPTLS
jgi:hypothetical protein